MNEDIDVAVVESIEVGIARSCSLMAVGPSARHAVDLLRRHPGITFGIHLTLVRDSVADQWGPLAEGVPSLLDDTGRLFTADERATLLARARLDEVEVEFRAQIDAVADGGRDDILELTGTLAAGYGLAVRVWLDEGRRRMRRRRGLPVTDNPFLDSFSVDVDTKPARYARLLRDLPPGLSEWAVHPSVADHRSGHGGWQVRRSDYEFLISPRARELVDGEQITVIDYRPLQEVWASSTSR
ncbi:putative glycoside hydrolase/deacetylase ChbG (UPF0249 family) [Saccharothrix ecbatanensis]|uniref:Putative glycoside hydrolase/deacetylase ChbG (UPF0249 family) n=2 Tax=Saccharothrix ecbatanensis TaxID=1105145 RepID=A0A7W9HM79_9PSEU|nr:putative glycoside hydrolase/deacetylase ChbG (UPF0249 family) [Saccharothrix ecbatanensis]